VLVRHEEWVIDGVSGRNRQQVREGVGEGEAEQGFFKGTPLCLSQG
jgi:hypothetical protein